MVETTNQAAARSEDKHAPILVVGGGVGGVSTALALGRQGRKVTLLEQADQIGAIGYGVQIGPNVIPMLERLGVGEPVRRAAYLPDRIRLYELETGVGLIDIPLQTPDFGSRYADSKYIAIHRVDLHELLLAACKKYPNITLNQSTTVTGYASTPSGVALSTADGRSIEGAAAIAADGLRSRLRAQMFPGDEPRDTGYLAHRTIVPMDQAPEAARRRNGVTMWTGPGFHVIYYPLRGRSELNIVVVVQVPPGMAPNDDVAYRAHIQSIMDSAQPEPREVIALCSLERRWSIADRNPIRRWADGNVTLLGDSAHATLQSLAQGAGMAIEDAVTLAAIVEHSGSDYATAFRRFHAERFLRTARVQLESRALWEMFHCGGVDAEVRTQAYLGRTHEDTYRCLDWLWLPSARVAVPEVPSGEEIK